MKRNDLLQRITSNSLIFGGKPIIRGMRISVEMVLDLLSQGVCKQELLKDYPDLVPEDILACLAYARAVLADEEIEVLNLESAG
tara:strand:- start:43 stop:294 length:252 start_codon:yes stop_codon:yes gene_type:complete